MNKLRKLLLSMAMLGAISLAAGTTGLARHRWHGHNGHHWNGYYGNGYVNGHSFPGAYYGGGYGGVWYANNGCNDCDDYCDIYDGSVERLCERGCKYGPGFAVSVGPGYWGAGYGYPGWGQPQSYGYSSVEVYERTVDPYYYPSYNNGYVNGGNNGCLPTAYYGPCGY